MIKIINIQRQILTGRIHHKPLLEKVPTTTVLPLTSIKIKWWPKRGCPASHALNVLWRVLPAFASIIKEKKTTKYTLLKMYIDANAMVCKTFLPPVLHLSLTFTFAIISVHVLTHTLYHILILTLVLLHSIHLKAFSTLSSGFSFSLGSLFPFQICSPFSHRLSYNCLYFVTEKETPTNTVIEFCSFVYSMFPVMLYDTISKKQIRKFLLSVGGKPSF